jgi:CelD/BcsL family acetyltransferase involved in cellulose biosynthesis
VRLERLDPAKIDWTHLDGFDDRVLFQTREWLDFVVAGQRAEPVVAAVADGEDTVGYFTGLVVRRAGMRILGSPLPGWTTASMGFNLKHGSDRRRAAAALPAFAFRELGCVHLELKDRRLDAGALDGLGYTASPTLTFELDLTRDHDAIFGGMTSACRRAIRKSEKEGVVVEEADGEGFADEYYAQLVEVFARQGLRPTYGVDRVRQLIRFLEPTGRLLLLRARSSEGEMLATGLFPAFNGVAYFWGGASRRESQSLRPNEAILWHAIRRWKSRGMETLDFGGGGEYKRKYGVTELWQPHFRRSRWAAVSLLREGARHAFALRQRFVTGRA